MRAGDQAQSYQDAEQTLLHLVSTPDHALWKPLANTCSPSSSTNATTPSAEALSSTNATAGAATKSTLRVDGQNPLDPWRIKLHKRSCSFSSSSSGSATADVVRASVEVPLEDAGIEREGLLESFRVALQSTEIRSSWDKLVEQATTLEILDPLTKVVKTDYRLGWPASPKDTVTISKTIPSSSDFLIQVASSLPRFADEPSFLRPSPPYVRSHVNIQAWVFHIVPSPTTLPPTAKRSTHHLRVSMYWSWNPNTRLNPASSSTLSSSSSYLATHMPHLVASLVHYVRSTRVRIPTLLDWNREQGIEVVSEGWDENASKWTAEWDSVFTEPGTDDRLGSEQTVKVQVPTPLSSTTMTTTTGRDGWDIRIESKRTIIDTTDKEPFRFAIETKSGTANRLVLKVVQDRIEDKDGLNKVKIAITKLVGGKGIRINGQLTEIKVVDSDQDQFDISEEEATWKRILEHPQQKDINEGTVVANTTRTPSIRDSSAISLRSTTGSIATNATCSITTQSQISTLLRRSYIYFLSLLQEPPAKWKPITDSASGVTITQLLSPDPTLTIYRAEAVFVGVGVWDVFASVLSGGKGSWDKGLDETKLIRQERGRATTNGAELSELWWEKRKGNWPVAPRDSVFLRTSYKSPTSIHIFSSSTDDTSLFPAIPPVQPPTIRTQTDLSGWSIESLSPTTTSITLLDQSDPKGWSNKSWTPNQLVQAVAGVRDFTLRNGAPPVVTRLSGARKREVGYDHDKGTFRVEYECDGPASVSHSESDHDTKSDTSSLAETVSSTSTRKPSPGEPTNVLPIELELRCDVSVWSPHGLELMVDPPPSSVSCLSRHRLSAGGGLWLTIEHPPLIVESEGKVTVTVKKASKGGPTGGSEKGGVSINGARVKVDVEVLEDDKIRELEGRKRRKISPVPLDQYDTLGARVWTSSSSPGSQADLRRTSNTVEGDKLEGLSLARTKVGEAGKTEENTKATLNVATDGSSAALDIAAPLIDSNVGTLTTSTSEPTSSTDKPSLEPPAAALEALAYLQSFHAEQGPDLTDPAPGWSVVSERGGTVVRKKTVPGISTTFPVYRGDKIVQGLTADEIASVVTSTGCRKVWDERVEKAVPLSSYGNGVSTTALSTKPAFPFKGRIFYVSTVIASVKVPSASSTSSTSTVLFVASASYTPPPAETDPFDPARTNPNSLLTGEVLLEGWILETLDPYTSSVLAIPSTRCTYLACIDQKGSVPLALNQVLNANLAKSIANVETLGKTKGPLPRIWSPSNGVQIEGPLSEDDVGDCVWKLGKSVGEGHSRVITANFGEEENTFRALFKVGGRNDRGTSKDDVTTRDDVLEKKSPSTATKSLAVGSTLLRSELPRSASLNFGTAAPPILHKPAITSELSHKRSRGSLRSKSPAAPPVATGAPPSVSGSAVSVTPASSSSLTSPNDPNAHDTVIAELIVDLKQYPHGYSVLASSALLPALSPEQGSTTSSLVSLDALPPKSLAPSSALAPVLPLRLIAHDAPLPSILTASLDAWKRANHLVRLIIPTSSVTHPLQDPLREPVKSIEKPEWYKLLTDEGGALVEIKIVPLPAPVPIPGQNLISTSDKTKPKPVSSGVGANEPTGLGKVTGQANRTVMFNGEKVVVMSQKESRAVLARFEDEDAPLQGAKISRVPPRRRKSASPASEGNLSTLPVELQQPLAIATHLRAPIPSTPVTDDFEFPDPKSPGMMTPAYESGRDSPAMSKSGSVQAGSHRRGTTSSESTPLTGPLSAILGSYPLARLGSSIVNATTPSSAQAPLVPGGLLVQKRGYSLGSVIAVALIAFLLGSFLRSLLTPADYIVYHAVPATSSATSSSVAGDSVEKALLTAFDPHRRWKEAKRLVELRTGFVGWDLIVAAVKRD
ncbi:uncharacterized protein JCM15063_004284 [Sporobolomyces koalae]|uniref:uncharacterized protein n=1 Tax=Sporobolomyces koalae TaxID=500713 RepID=UPI0031779362